MESVDDPITLTCPSCYFPLWVSSPVRTIAVTGGTGLTIQPVHDALRIHTATCPGPTQWFVNAIPPDARVLA